MNFIKKLFGRATKSPSELHNNISGTANVALPKIDEQLCELRFGTQPDHPISGHGASVQKEAIIAYNDGDIKSFIMLYEQALLLGIDEEYDRSLLHKELAVEYVMMGKIIDAINHFYKAISFTYRAPTATWYSAMYLYFVYDEIGRNEEAKALFALAQETQNRIGVDCQPTFMESNVRTLVSKSNLI